MPRPDKLTIRGRDLPEAFSTVGKTGPHPAYLFYVLSGGKAQVRDEKGTREVEIRAGSHVDAPPVPWHEVANIGNTTLQFLNVEKKYRPAPSVSQTVCLSKAR